MSKESTKLVIAKTVSPEETAKFESEALLTNTSTMIKELRRNNSLMAEAVKSLAAISEQIVSMNTNIELLTNMLGSTIETATVNNMEAAENEAASERELFGFADPDSDTKNMPN